MCTSVTSFRPSTYTRNLVSKDALSRWHAQLGKKISLRFNRERSRVRVIVKIHGQMQGKLRKIRYAGKDVERCRFSQFTDERKERGSDQKGICVNDILTDVHVPNPNKSAYRVPHSSKSENAEKRGVKKQKKKNKNLCPPARFTRARGEKLTPRNFVAHGFKYREYHANIRSLIT